MPMIPTETLRSLLGLAPLLLLHAPALGQIQDLEPRWYQVELVIFAQGDPFSGEEVWRTDLELNYPSDWLELREPDQAEMRLVEQSAQEPPSGAITPADRERALEDDALLALPSSEFQLSEEVERLRDSSQFRLLFHEAWRQPFVENRREPAILIAGGDEYEAHHELEGSIRLYMGTYLHIDTDLWLARFTTNFGQETLSWPSPPRAPNRSAPPQEAEAFGSADSALWQLGQDRPADEYQTILESTYVVEHITAMAQQRRMRSGELHYIDHPLMGVLVKLTPYEPEESEDDGSGRDR